ncbi:MAG TPA: DNA polymerase [Vicinamibacterales bacterium]|jgi:DNA polymerase-1|nr:DNA polymerase [Vicinamibacterales bacterium]
MTETVHTSPSLQVAAALGGIGAIEPMVGALPKGAEHHQWAVAAGCECWRCPLLACGRGPVPPTLPANTDATQPVDVLVVAEAPGSTEVQYGQTLVGASGKLLKKTLAETGMPTERVGYTNAVLCQPEGTMKDYLRVVKKQGKASPIDCCRPRLQTELNNAKYVILMGGASLQAAGLGDSIMKLRGTPLEINLGHRKMPALGIPHAAFTMRDEGRIYAPIFRADIVKAVRIAYSGSSWRDPWYFVPKTAAEVANFLAVPRDRVSTDVETDGIDTWQCGLRRVGIGTDKEVMIYRPLSVHGHYLLTRDEIQAQTRAIAEFYQRQPRLDLHNGLAFDSVVLWRHGMPIPDERIFDTMVAHQVGNTSELPHSLDFLGSTYTDAPYWKDDVKHSNVRDDAILDRYLSFDIGVTHQSAPFVEANLVNANQTHVYQIDHEMFRIGRSMSMLGIGVDQKKRWEFAVEYHEKSARLLGEFMQLAGREVNPNSPKQMQQLLYKDLGLPVLEEHYTSTGDPSTDENTLLDLLSLGVDARAEKIIHAIIGVREAEKILGTFIGHPTPMGIEGGPNVHADGRLRAVWRPGKRSGRWGSSEPNMQNIIKRLRQMYIPAPGNVYVAADMSAVELRMIALLAGDGPLIQAFAEFDAGKGPDVHTFNACMVFKTTTDKVTPKVRDMIKRFVYALAYDAQPPKIHQTLSLLRDDNLQPLFPGITLAEVERLYNLWWQLHPAIPAYKKKLLYGWRSTGYIATQWHQRKRFFIGGEKQEEMGNHPIQGSSADMQNTAIKELVSAYPFDYARHRGLVVNGHDQLVVECGEDEAEAVKVLVNRVMERRVGPMLFPAKPVAAKDWKAVS